MTLDTVDWTACDVSILLNQNIVHITATEDHVLFRLWDGRLVICRHDQDCCESVTLEDTAGDWQDLIGAPILVAEERTEEKNGEDYGDHETWTFYTLRNIRGSVDMRWYGTSNGYYSERVDWGVSLPWEDTRA